MQNDKKTTTIRIRKEDFKRLDALAKYLGKPKVDVIRDSIGLFQLEIIKANMPKEVD